MADFCTKCASQLFGNNVSPEIDMNEIINRLSPDTYEVVLCEGCGMVGVGKDTSGHIYIAYPDDAENADPTTVHVRWYTLDEYEETNKQKSQI
jgi:hypothetical protein